MACRIGCDVLISIAEFLSGRCEVWQYLSGQYNYGVCSVYLVYVMHVVTDGLIVLGDVH